MKKIQNNLWLVLLFAALAFPAFYFVYKFGDVEPMAHDYFQYYYLYKDMAIFKVIAPHNMRFVGAFFVHLFYQANFFYDTACVYDKYQAWGFLKQVYFNAVFFNFLCVVLTAVVIYKNVWFKLKHQLWAFVAGLLYLLGFGTMFFELMPCTDAFSVLLFAYSFNAYLQHKRIILWPLLVLIFQREYLLIVFSTLGALDYLKTRQRYYLLVAITALVAFAVHVLLRKTVFYTAHLDHQASITTFVSNALHPQILWGQYFKQLLLGLNVFVLYLAFYFYNSYQNKKQGQWPFWQLIILFLQINVICILAGHGNNCGRYFYMVVPMVIYELVLLAHESFHFRVYQESQRDHF